MKKVIINYGGYIFFYGVLIIGLLILCTTPINEDVPNMQYAIASVNN